MANNDKPLAWLHGEIKTPPFSKTARIEAGALLRRLQEGETLGMPACRPMPGVGPRCRELRVVDEKTSWRIFCRVDPDAILILAVVEKKTQKTPKHVIDTCRDRLKRYDETKAKAKKEKGK